MKIVKKTLENTVYWIGVLTLGIVAGISIRAVSAWVEPEQLPPGGNIAAPLNTGNTGQSKQGGLTLNIGGATYGLIVEKGLVGIKTTDPQVELDVNGDIHAHNLNLDNDLNVEGDTNIDGNLNVKGTINGNGTNKICSGTANVTFYNGTPNSNLTHIDFPSPCNSCYNPRVFTQTQSDSILCGTGSAPSICNNHLGTTSTDLHARYTNVGSSGMDVFLSAMDGVWACKDGRTNCASSDFWGINWLVMCDPLPEPATN